jgi:proline racemase
VERVRGVRLSVDAVDTHVQGDHARVVLGGGVGVLAVPGATMFEKMTWFEREADWFRLLMLREPRGNPQCCVNLVLPPIDPRARAGFIIMEQQRYYAAMSGTNLIAVATVLLETGLVPMVEPITEFCLEPPAGLVAVRAHCSDGRAKRIDFTNVPSFCTKLDVPLAVDGFGTLTVSLSFGGMAYVVVDSTQLGFDVRPHEVKAVRDAAMALMVAAGERIGFAHPLNPELSAIEGAVLYRRPDAPGGRIRQVPVNRSGQVGRSAAGTACSATLAVLHARGEVDAGDRIEICGIFDNPFSCSIDTEVSIGPLSGIVPTVGGQAFVTGWSRYVLMEDDPFPTGFVLGDIWPMADEASPASMLATEER